MKDKFIFIYEKVTKSMELLDQKKISVDQAKAMASLAKQANNTIVTQLDAAKFVTNVSNSQKGLTEVGLL